MGSLNPNQGLHGLSNAQAENLANKMRGFWDELSPEEQAHLDFTLRRVIDESPDVAGQAWMVEYAVWLQAMVYLLG